MSLYGTRDAAVNFQEEVGRYMRQIGFKQGSYNPCTYYHVKKGLKTMVHGDDFVTSGSREEARWLRERLAERFEIKTKVIGSGAGEVSEGRVLNRIIRVGSRGWQYEPDQRHAEILIKTMGLENAKPVKTPGEEENKKEEEQNAQELDKGKSREYRGMTARANYLAQDRIDIQYAVKELSRAMAAPTVGDWKKLKRLGRYLVGRPRVVTSYPWQEEVVRFTGYSDSDWAGCKKTAKSTSGGVIQKGSHYIRSWSSTQKCVTLSSGEAELVAMVRTSTEVMGMIQLAADWGLQMGGAILADSAAALGVVKRKGCGKLRHVKVGQLWIQEKESTGELGYKKVKGDLNPADAGTKYLSESKMGHFMETVLQEPVGGRAETSLRVAGEEKEKGAKRVVDDAVDADTSEEVSAP